MASALHEYLRSVSTYENRVKDGTHDQKIVTYFYFVFRHSFFSYNTTLIDSSCNSLTFFGRRGIYDTRIYYRSTLRYVFCLGL